jgi:hypothetical protein
MKMLITIPFVLAVASAGAQTTNQSQVRHVETSLNHLTVIEFGEPVTTLAIADTDSFQVERHDDKVFVKPLREGVSTNLFVWTTCGDGCVDPHRPFSRPAREHERRSRAHGRRDS